MRPESLFPLFAQVSTLKGVGPKVAPLVEKLAGPLVRDVLFLKPHSLIHRKPSSFLSLVDGEVATLSVVVNDHQRPRAANQPWRIRVVDGESGFITITFFKGHGPHLERQHPVGAKRIVSGKVERFNDSWNIVHPDYFVDVARAAEVPELEAIYPATAGLPARTVRKMAHEALERAPDLAEWQDPAWLAREGWPSWRQALEHLHNPRDEADIAVLGRVRRRLAFDELLAHQLALAQRKAARKSEPAPAILAGPMADRLEAALPWKLTGAQIRALSEIRGDLQAGERMSRLLQGDVGSGKTVVCTLAMADVLDAGRQAALMAPTEILARQHFETIAPMLEAQGTRVILLTGRDKGGVRAEKLMALMDGTAGVAVGTHALFQDEVKFRGLSLAVIDEQHRFGVNERKRLTDKGDGVHLLAMSATPIPRTLELTVFGDLDVSRIDEKPPGRTPVATAAVPSPRLPQVIERLRNAVSEGAQAFWICPLVSESEELDVMAAETRAAELRKVMGSHVGLVHGQMSGAEKDEVMAAFAEGRLPVLVATTVVEVGVNVPNATIMVIEHADRFGLAQLHQLRGRVGRGRRESACLLIYDPPLGDIAEQRLDILRKTDDGFEIAEKDLELRGGGDPLGLKQSGFPAYRLADPAAHRDLIAVAADDARLVLTRDPELTGERGMRLRTLQELFDWRPGAQGD
ncbi:ATP-dependent DNA helicase RecG [Caulobacter sp. NIBR1757]|uniref:ATP-dependent DNA helicase RecG n=1 Tax=Caulobacter sp. NIBR1757 TaxID=3016000 RepID=UPI0022F13EDE|nr:ATP-dependent DNA helicase RecG [Caulobacter sp. NIBR1757]WGM38884.1 ATP-dependent DNA helicase RecG [Caulobacter sp. NIBR1757]